MPDLQKIAWGHSIHTSALLHSHQPDIHFTRVIYKYVRRVYSIDALAYSNNRSRRPFLKKKAAALKGDIGIVRRDEPAIPLFSKYEHRCRRFRNGPPNAPALLFLSTKPGSIGFFHKIRCHLDWLARQRPNSGRQLLACWPPMGSRFLMKSAPASNVSLIRRGEAYSAAASVRRRSMIKRMFALAPGHTLIRWTSNFAPFASIALVARCEGT